MCVYMKITIIRRKAIQQNDNNHNNNKNNNHNINFITINWYSYYFCFVYIHSPSPRDLPGQVQEDHHEHEELHALEGGLSLSLGRCTSCRYMLPVYNCTIIFVIIITIINNINLLISKCWYYWVFIIKYLLSMNKIRT